MTFPAWIAPNAYWFLGHIFPVVLDDQGIPHHYATECNHCGEHIVNVQWDREPCKKNLRST